MNVYDVITKSNYGQTHSVVADSIGEAERIFLGKYWPIDIEKIELHSVYVQIQKHDEQAKKTAPVQQPTGASTPFPKEQGVAIMKFTGECPVCGALSQSD